MVFGIGGNDKENASPTNAATPAPGKADAGRKAGKPLATPDILAAMLDSDSEDESVRARAPPDTPARSDRIPPPRARQSFVVLPHARPGTDAPTDDPDDPPTPQTPPPPAPSSRIASWRVRT